MREHLLRIAVIAAGVLALGAVTAAFGQGLTTIHPRGGGMIMYGQVQGQATEGRSDGATSSRIFTNRSAKNRRWASSST